MYYVSVSVVTDPNRNTVITILPFNRRLGNCGGNCIDERNITLIIEISKGRKGVYTLAVRSSLSSFSRITTFVVIKRCYAFYTLHEANEFCLKWHSGKPLRLLPSEKAARK